MRKLLIILRKVVLPTIASASVISCASEAKNQSSTQKIDISNKIPDF